MEISKETIKELVKDVIKNDVRIGISSYTDGKITVSLYLDDERVCSSSDLIILSNKK